MTDSKVTSIRPGLKTQDQPHIPNAYDAALEAIMKLANRHKRKLIIISDLPKDGMYHNFSRRADPDWINTRLDEVKHDLFAPHFEIEIE